MDSLSPESAPPERIYGELTRDVFYATYSFEQAMAKLELLLAGDAWRGIAPGFDDVNMFLRSLKLDRFRIVAEQRKAIAERIRELQPEASNRAIAEAMGVGRSTVDRDLSGPNGPPSARKAAETRGLSGPNGPPQLSGAEAARQVAALEGGRARRRERFEAVLHRIVMKNPPLPVGRKWPIIYADPAWRDEFGPNLRSIENHYPTMSVEEILALPVQDIAADDAILFLWGLPHMFLTAADVMKAWGFTYRTHYVWSKPKFGLGQYARNEHENLLIGRRGAFPPPFESDRVGSVIETSLVIEAPTGAHSEKPGVFAELIEAWYPADVPKIELFCRGRPRSGWDGWGNEAEASTSPPVPASDDIG